MPNPFKNIFTSATPAPQTPVDPAAPAQPAPATPDPATGKLADQTPSVTPVQTPGTAANGVVPDNVETPQSPLDQFKDLWDTKPNENTPQGFIPESIDPAKLQEVISKVNMTSVITPELQARINVGGEDAVKANQEALNLVAQQTLMQSTTVANKMFETQSAKLVKSIMDQIPGLVKEQSVNSALHKSNPIFSNPAVAPVISAVKDQLQLKNPNATADELTDMAQNFVKVLGESIAPAPINPTDASGEIDWSNWENQV